MSRSYWNVYVKTTGSWVADGFIARPNDDTVLGKKSNMTVVPLVDGEEAYVTPATKSLKQPINFVWMEDDGTIKTKIEDYVDNCTPVKIIDHNSVAYVGKFISSDSKWLVGVNPDTYDIQATFKPMPQLA